MSASSTAPVATAAPSSKTGTSWRTAMRLLKAVQGLSSVVPSIGRVVFPKSFRRRRDESAPDEEMDDDGDYNEEDYEGDHASSSGKSVSVDNADKMYALLGNAGREALAQPVVVAGGPPDWIKDPSSLACPPTLLEKAINYEIGSVTTCWNNLNYSEDVDVTRIDILWHQLYQGPIAQFPLAALQSVWEQAAPSPFGDVANQVTVLNESVRNARELLAPQDFTVAPIMCHRLAELWSSHMLPRRVRVEPYKLNVYGPGGKFAPHKDTPAAGLVGTILIGLGDTTDAKAGLKISTDRSRTLPSGNLISQASSSTGSAGVVWRAVAGSICMFYPDVTHEVLPIESGLRGTLAFKVFADETCLTAAEKFALLAYFGRLSQQQFGGFSSNHQPKSENELRSAYLGSKSNYDNVFVSQMSRMGVYGNKPDPFDQMVGNVTYSDVPKKLFEALSECPTPFGILLDHAYSQETENEQLRGSDAMIYQMLADSGVFDVTVLPVIVHVNETGPSEDEHVDSDSIKVSSGTASFGGVYPANESIIDFICAQPNVPRANRYGMTPDTTSFPVHIPGVQWNEKLPFYLLSHPDDASARENLLLSTLTSHGGHYGNDSEPSTAQSIYLHRAIIVRQAISDASVAETLKNLSSAPDQ